MLKKLGPYKILGKLGQGGMAEVFKAIKTGPEGFEKPIALKRIIPPLADKSDFISMLLSEAKLHAQLDHPNLVQLIDFFEEDGQYFLSLEYVPGITLQSLRSQTTLDWQTSAWIISQALKGLDYAHNKKNEDGQALGIVHRDVSPQNILISQDGLVKLTDFGIAWSKDYRSYTQSGALKGKVPYLSPEQVKGQSVDRRSDLFSMGSVLYELIYGQASFTGSNEFETMKRIEEGRFTHPDSQHFQIPQSIVSILNKALSLQPEKRYQSASEFRNALVKTLSAEWKDQGEEKLQSFMEHFSTKPLFKRLKTTAIWAPHMPTNKKNLLSAVPFILISVLGIWWVTKLSPKPVQTTAIVKKAPITQRLSTLKFEGPDNALVFINGKEIGTLPLESLTLEEGSYIVLLKTKNGQSRLKKINIKLGEEKLIQW